MLDFYVDCLEQPAGTLRADDPLCQGVECQTTNCLNGRGEVVRTVTKERLLLPSQVECGLALREMCGWDKKGETEAPDELTEVMLLIRKRSGSNGLPKPEIVQLPPERSSEHLPALPPNHTDSATPSIAVT